ncbi:addiction module protein [Parapedobacter tibetensis]|uniref:addiction module protein n=1 Tax=Parapedobacter tibetensis TaxID=2972951 RepID=UPI002152A10D|nr:addiction module protein [Parapedobacter tibetensis]
MPQLKIREKLYDYIRYADEKKVKAIYTMVEDEIEAKTNLWEDPSFLEELDRRVDDFESGRVKASSWDEVKAKALALRK